MQNLITLVGLASLANAASLVTTVNQQMDAKEGDNKKRQNHDVVDALEGDSVVLGGPLTGFKNLCDPCKKDDVCEQRYLNTFCDFTIDNDANDLVYGLTKTLITKLDLPSSVRFVTQSPPTADNLVCPY